jgi:hypothetical protein
LGVENVIVLPSVSSALTELSSGASATLPQAQNKAAITNTEKAIINFLNIFMPSIML